MTATHSAFNSVYDPATHSFKIPEDIRGNALFRLFGLYLVAIQIVRKPELLLDLKGSVANVLSVIAMHLNKDTLATFIGVRLMVKESGYQSQAVTNALNKLEALGFISRARRKHDSTLYVLKAPFSLLPVKENQLEDDSQNEGVSKVKTYQKMNDDMFRKSKQVHVIPQLADDTFRKSKHETGKAKPELKNPAPESAKAKPESAELPLPPEWMVARGELLKTGMHQHVVDSLLEVLRERERTPQYVLDWLKVYRARREAGEVHSVGWLRCCLEKNDPVPDQLTLKKTAEDITEAFKQELEDPYWGQFYARGNVDKP